MNNLYILSLCFLLGSCSSGITDTSNQIIEYSIVSVNNECPLPLINGYSISFDAIDETSYKFSGKVVGKIGDLKHNQLELINAIEQYSEIIKH